MYGVTLIDESQVGSLCHRLLGVLDGTTRLEDGLQILSDIDRKYRFAGEKTARLKGLFGMKRIPDLGRWKYEVLSNVKAIEQIAGIHNQCSRQLIDELRCFRVELRPPWDWERSPVVFVASVYVADRFHGAISCVVTDDELSRLPIGTRSLSKRQARLRRIGDYCRAFEAGFPAHIERCWEKGEDLTQRGRLTWTEVAAR
ncbi:MAG: hypothetical protein KGJ79_16175 [Alphaproteobacteria bacterium]|nr:hypothetical protein [Alphaproteobacteria bacterium]MDE2112679.1 hypothetical protein [Alphaproteobacteria bacterium]